MSRRCIVNGRDVVPQEVRELVGAVSSPKHLVVVGGFLFRARMTEESAFIGALPVVLGAQRNYHHDIELGTDLWPRSVGMFWPDLTLQVLCFPGRGPHDTRREAVKSAEQITELCRFLIAYGYPGNRRFDDVTLRWFADSGLFPVEVRTVTDAAEHRRHRSAEKPAGT